MPMGKIGWDRIRREARSQVVDLSKYIDVREAAAIMRCSRSTVLYHFDWLEGVTLCGLKFVKRDRTEWLRKFRDGQLTSDDQMGESLAPFDVAARRAEIERQKKEQEDERRRQAEADRPRGFHIDGTIWWDYDNNDTWVPTRYALNTFNQTRQALYALARRGLIRRRWADAATWQPVDPETAQRLLTPNAQTSRHSNRIRSMWSLRDIERYMERRNSRGRLRDFSFDDPGHPFTPTRVYTLDRAAHERKLISRNEAAEILGVSPSGVTDLVTLGKLKCYQKIQHRPGSRIWLSEDEVVSYANNPDRLERRARYWRTRMAKDMGTWQKKENANFCPTYDSEVIDYGRSLKKSNGEYYTLKQAAVFLDCTKDNVRAKIKMGILKGYKAKTDDPNAKWNERRWWFVKKDELHKYMRSPEYRRRRATWLNHHGGPK